MSSEPIDPVAEAVGKSVGEISVALLLLIHALKQQPGFDLKGFDNRIKQVLKDSDIEEGSITESILKGALAPKI